MFRLERCLGHGRSRGGGIRRQNLRYSHQTQICKCTNMKIHIYAHTKLKADIVKTNIRSKKYNLTDKSTQNVQTKAKKMNMEGRASSPLPKHNCENLTKHHSHSCNLKTTQRRGSHISHNQRK